MKEKIHAKRKFLSTQTTKDEIAEDDQEVKGIIIAFEDDQRIRRALKS